MSGVDATIEKCAGPVIRAGLAIPRFPPPAEA